ncbi:MAG: o-succinylbenzoate synthase, partial [Bacteroidales bacterium]|nr:o-succinylbenzoate synthase [Bacteroidales bacterium]
LELRVDANGAFKPSEALGKLEKLARFDLHSIEQPIRQGQVEKMAKLCKETPIPIALDEELIGILDLSEKKHLLKEIAPQYIILKPALVGGFKASEEWIELSEGLHIPWWITSALESNIGLSAISQWTSSFENPMYQGLGTGQLYTNNFPCPLLIKNAELWYSNKKNWDLSALNF